MPSDRELLLRYVDDGSAAAFNELVQRHINLVYFSALRRVGRNAHSADDVAQKVFTDLARKAKTLRGHPNLAGWLYTATRFAAADVVRAERRRRAHEEEAHTMNELNSPQSHAEAQLEPFLDEIMDLLNEQDRDAVLLHFFEDRPFAEVGAALALTADAARMRVNRALERLRAELAKRGIASSATALVATLTNQSALAVPAPLVLAMASRALSHAGASAGSGSFVGRLLQSAKASSWTARAGGAAAIVTAIVAVRMYRSPASAVAASGSHLPLVLATSSDGPKADVETDAVSPAASAATDQPDRPASEVVSASALAGEFAGLSDAEKSVLKTLWAGPSGRVKPPRSLWVLHVKPTAPTFAIFAMGRSLLLAKGLITLRPVIGGAHLTKAGQAFCHANQDAIDAYPRFDWGD